MEFRTTPPRLFSRKYDRTLIVLEAALISKFKGIAFALAVVGWVPCGRCRSAATKAYGNNRYYGAPETTVEYVIFVADGTAGQPEVKETNKKLKHGEKYEFDVERPAGRVIRVSAYSESASLLGSAVSASPPAGH